MKFTEEELKAFRAEYAKGATDTQFDLFIAECEARNLRPGPHVVFQLRNSKEYDSQLNASVFIKKAYWITTIGALRLIALRTGQYGGPSDPEFIYLDAEGSPSIVSKIPLPHSTNKSLPREPWAVRVSVRRKDFLEPVTSIVRFDSVAGTRVNKDNGKTELVLTDMWAKRGPEQNAKCSEADALRKAFPEELGSLYLAEELKNEDPSPEVTQVGTVAAALPEVPTVPKVDQTPAVPTNNPRPGEQKLAPPPLTTEQITKAVEKVVSERAASEVSPDPAVSAPVETAQVIVTTGGENLPTETKTVETPLPEPKKRGRKPKSPVNGRPDLGTPNWESAEQMEEIAASPTTPEVSEEKKQEAADFVESISTFSAEEAIASNRPVASEAAMPYPDQFKVFVDRMRACTGPGVDIQTLGSYSFKFTGKEKAKLFTVNDWIRLLNTIEAAKADGSLVGVVKQ